MSNDAKRGGGDVVSVPHDLVAGDFSAWLRGARHALLTGAGVAVPCGDCTACCTSSYFIHIAPGETQTLARINRKLLFAAPGLPKGHVVMGYDQHGHCPMLIENRCSVYAQRPRTCRAYDCRIFAAAGIAAGDDDKALINQRIARWQFSYPSQHDRNEHVAVQAAAMFLQAHADRFPDASNSSQLAMLAIKVYEVFLMPGEDADQTERIMADAEIIEAIMAANEKFAASRDVAEAPPD